MIVLTNCFKEFTTASSMASSNGEPSAKKLRYIDVGSQIDRVEAGQT